MPIRDRAADLSRRFFLRSTAIAAPAAALAATAGGPASAAGGFSFPQLYGGSNAHDFHSMRKHENDHVAAIVKGLTPYGSAFGKPAFVNLKQPNAGAFAANAFTFENTAVGAYVAAIGLLSDPTIIAEAASILAIESRHAGYMNVLVNAPLSNGDESFQSAISLTAAAHTIALFFANPAIPVSLASAVSSVSSLPNDIRILKFALALEYLQAEYYNVNVPIYFG